MSGRPVTRSFLLLAVIGVSCGVAPPATSDTPPATVTLEAITAPATASDATASRVTTIEVAVAPPPVPVGLHGLPFAPDGLNPCDDMEFYRIQAGLPERFQAIGWRESRCLNRDDVRTYCCFGFWQLYVSVFLQDHRAGPRFREYCAIFSHDDVNSDTPIDKQRQACGAAVILDIQGYQAWALS